MRRKIKTFRFGKEQEKCVLLFLMEQSEKPVTSNPDISLLYSRVESTAGDVEASRPFSSHLQYNTPFSRKNTFILLLTDTRELTLCTIEFLHRE